MSNLIPGVGDIVLYSTEYNSESIVAPAMVISIDSNLADLHVFLPDNTSTFASQVEHASLDVPTAYEWHRKLT